MRCLAKHRPNMMALLDWRIYLYYPPPVPAGIAMNAMISLFNCLLSILSRGALRGRELSLLWTFGYNLDLGCFYSQSLGRV